MNERINFGRTRIKIDRLALADEFTIVQKRIKILEEIAEQVDLLISIEIAEFMIRLKSYPVY